MKDNSDILAMIRARSNKPLPKPETDIGVAYFWLGFFVACAFMAKLFG